VAAAVAVTGAALGLLRLLFGLWTIRRGWRRSTPVEEPGLLRLVEELRAALGVAAAVAVREAADLTTAATIGWLRPVLLLPPDWRGWTGAQRRAVLAHELAHVRRGDFAAWLLARLTVAMYFWHPLVRMLAGWLHLQQELAADADAAPLAGGRPAYLRALAELALRADGRARGWPAPAFLSRKGTLLRRVEMLRVTEDGLKCPAARTGRRLVIALLLALTLTASALRGQVREGRAEVPDGPAKPAEEKVAPFDLALLAPGDDQACGVFGVRPAAILNRPGMALMRTLFNDRIDATTAALKTGGAGIHIEEVEQVMGRVYIRGENKPGKRMAMLSLNVLRTTRDVDWAKLRDQCGPKMKQHRWQGETYVSCPMTALLKVITGTREDGYLWAPDARTLVFDSERAIKALIEARAAGSRPADPGYTAGWDLVSRGLFAVALDNRGRRLVKRTLTDEEMKAALADPKKAEYHLVGLCRNVSGVVLGCADVDDFRFDLRASAATPDDAAAVARHCEGLLAEARKMVLQAKTGATLPEQGVAALDFVTRILDRAAVRRDGTVVTVHAGATSGLDALLAGWAKDFAQGKK
jgi:beta-lactamase regulating signal transducer with metallopeptidase domain